jgi:hypothetical protein
MTQLVVPTEWRAPIRVMTQGECYYGTDGWTADHVMAQAS